MQVYNKLIRDKVAQAVTDDGGTPVVRSLDEHEFVLALAVKLQEEWGEFLAVPSAEELADVLEVLRAVATAFGFEWSHVERVRLAKHEEAGGFEKRRFLERIES